MEKHEYCIICGTKLTDRQLKFCSSKCSTNKFRKVFPVTLCVVCGNRIPDKRLHRRAKYYCSEECSRKRQVEKLIATNGNYHDNALATATMGAISEHKVIAELLYKGYEVFRASSPACSCDLIMSKNGTTLRVEVRTGWYNYHGEPLKSQMMQKHKADILALVMPDKIIYVPELNTEAKVEVTA